MIGDRTARLRAAREGELPSSSACSGAADSNVAAFTTDAAGIIGATLADTDNASAPAHAAEATGTAMSEAKGGAKAIGATVTPAALGAATAAASRSRQAE